jgi:hypothetical protein
MTSPPDVPLPPEPFESLDPDEDPPEEELAEDELTESVKSMSGMVGPGPPSPPTKSSSSLAPEHATKLAMALAKQRLVPKYLMFIIAPVESGRRKCPDTDAPSVEPGGPGYHSHRDGVSQIR